VKSHQEQDTQKRYEDPVSPQSALRGKLVLTGMAFLRGVFVGTGVAPITAILVAFVSKQAHLSRSTLLKAVVGAGVAMGVIGAGRTHMQLRDAQSEAEKGAKDESVTAVVEDDVPARSNRHVDRLRQELPGKRER
jgi:hypothetical protein